MQRKKRHGFSMALAGALALAGLFALTAAILLRPEKRLSFSGRPAFRGGEEGDNPRRRRFFWGKASCFGSIRRRKNGRFDFRGAEKSFILPTFFINRSGSIIKE